MKISTITKILLVPWLLVVTQLHAEQEVIVGVGKGMDSTLIQSKSISNAEEKELILGFKLADFNFFLPGNMEWWLQAGYATLDGEHLGKNVDENISQMKPIIRWYPSGDNGQFFYEAGLGLAYLSNQDFKKIHLPTNVNFSLHAAMGWKLNQSFKISLKYNHFSNGYTHTPNPGLDYLSLNLHWDI